MSRNDVILLIDDYDIFVKKYMENNMKNMQSFESDGYPYYEAGMILPNGVFPPLEGYTHEALIEEACSLAYEYLISKEVNTTLAKETVFSIGALINEAFEKEYVEYELATYSQKPYENSAARTKGIEGMAADFSVYASRAAIEAIKDSPIRVIGEDAFVGLIRCIRHGIRDRILTIIDIKDTKKETWIDKMKTFTHF